MEEQKCTCGDDLKKLCAQCTPERREKVVNRAVGRAQGKSRLGPIRRWVVRVDASNSNSRAIARRLAAVQVELERVTGRRLSKREVREYLKEQGRRMWEKELLK